MNFRAAFSSGMQIAYRLRPPSPLAAEVAVRPKTQPQPIDVLPLAVVLEAVADRDGEAYKGRDALGVAELGIVDELFRNKGETGSV